MSYLKKFSRIIFFSLVFTIIITINQSFSVSAQSTNTSISSFTLASEFLLNKSYTISGNGSSQNGVLYQFWILDYSINQWQVAQDYSEKNSFNWTPAKAGKYRVELHVKDKYSSQFFEANAYKDVEVYNVLPAKVSEFTVNSVFYVNNPVNVSGSGTSSNSVLYQFWIMDYSKGTWNLVQDYSTKNTFAWTPSKAGKYRVEMHIKDLQSTKYFDDNAFKDIEVKIPAPAKISSFTLNTEFYLNRNYNISGNASSENGALYQFWMLDYSTNQWQVAQDYSTNGNFNWTPTKVGRYRIELHVKDKYSSEFFEANSYKDVMVYDPLVARNATIYIDSNYNVTAAGESGNKVLFQYWVLNYGVGNWELVRDYSESNSYNWAPNRPGKYRVEVHIKDINSSQFFDSNAFQDIEIRPQGYIGNTYLTYSYYNISFNDFVNKEIANIPAMQVRNANGIYEWRYAKIKNGQLGYVTNPSDLGTWVYSPDQYNAILQELINKSSPDKLISDDTQIYQFVKLSYVDGVTAADLNSMFAPDGVLTGKGQVFLDAAKTYNVNPIYLAAHAILETGNGKSQLAKGISVNGTIVYNLFGIGAVDSDPNGGGSQTAYKYGWDTIDKAIFGGAKWIKDKYMSKGQDTLYKMRWNPANPPYDQYATDVRWAYNQAFDYKRTFDLFNNAKIVFDFPVFN